MSNFGLHRQVSELESKLRSIQNENDRLRSEIASTLNSVNVAEQDLANYNQHIRNTLDNANGAIINSNNKEISAYELQGEIDHLYTRYKGVELANKRIRALNNKKYYDFNNYRTVRKIVQGMMENLDLNMVSDDIIYKSIEKQHLQTPDYWLTCVLISAMAWKNDDKELADKAIGNAMKLDKKNSDIFYMIFNMRMGRDEAAVKWFMQYQQCDLKGSDQDTFLMLFSLISKTLNSKVDVETETQVKDFINQIILRSAEREGYLEEDIIGLIHKKMKGLMKIELFDFPLLNKHCKEYGDIINILSLSKNNYNILEFILKIENVTIQEKNTYLKEYLDELLSEPNLAEKETYDEIEYNELIIMFGGDIEKAKTEFADAKKRRESELDLVSNIISWIYDFSLENVNGQMRLNMFTLIKGIQEKATVKYFESYRKMVKNTFQIEIGEYSTNADLAEESKEVGKVEQFYQEKQNIELAEIKNIPAYVAFGAGAAISVAAFFVHLLLLVVGVASVIGGVCILFRNKQKAKNIIFSNKDKKRTTIEALQKLIAEFNVFKVTYKEFDVVSRNIMEEFTKF